MNFKLGSDKDRSKSFFNKSVNNSSIIPEDEASSPGAKSSSVYSSDESGSCSSYDSEERKEPLEVTNKNKEQCIVF